MKKCRFGILLLGAVMALSGCHKESNLPGNTQAYVPPEKDVEPTVEYGWASGESGVPNERIGLTRAGVNLTPHAVSPTGIYFFDKTDGDEKFIVYADNGSDTFIKLCGRPDCTHSTSDCNAYVFAGCELSYYGGYLYAASTSDTSSRDCKLIRMDPDGSNHLTVMDFTAFAKEVGGEFAKCTIITDGFCLFSVHAWKVTEEGIDYTKKQTYSLGYYYYKLDGSMEKPASAEIDGLACYSCGDAFLVHDPAPVVGSQYGSYYDWDPDTNSASFLTPHPGEPGWYGEDVGYYFKDGCVYRRIYATNKDEPVIDTELKGNYYVFAFPECLVVASDDDPSTDNNLYFYNWSFELLETVSIPNPGMDRTQFMLIAETAERIILTTTYKGMPTSYINKSELGTGEAKVHPFKYS